jgi:phytoene desaturase
MPYHSGQDWESATQQVRYSVLSDLKTHGIDISDKIECEDVFTPLDFKNKYFSNRGSIYGISSNSMMAAFQRPANRSRLLKNLYFTGGSSHPGGGVPLVILSGRHAAKIIALEDGINFQDFESGEYKRLVVML